MPRAIESNQAHNLLKLKISHGWFKKYGGVSSGSFESLNVKKGIGDSDQNVQENIRRAVSHLKLNQKKLFFIRHNFKDNILVVNQATDPGVHNNYDAVMTNRKDVVLAQGTADCGTIIISDIDSSFVALVHGSWHTTKLNIIKKVIAQIKLNYKVPPERFIISFGPMACGDCFEFGPEAVELFSANYLKFKGDKIFYNIKQNLIDQALDLGAKASNIWDCKICTIEDEDFFSYRRAKSRGQESGRLLSLASLN